MFAVASSPPLRLGSISMKAFSSIARARGASGLAGLLYRSSQLSWASWRPSMKLVRIICSSITGCPLYTLFASVRKSQKKQKKWFGLVADEQFSILSMNFNICDICYAKSCY